MNGVKHTSVRDSTASERLCEKYKNTTQFIRFCEHMLLGIYVCMYLYVYGTDKVLSSIRYRNWIYQITFTNLPYVQKVTSSVI